MDAKRVLFTFLSVYQHGSQLKAAQQLHLTQPAVSQHIKWLESKLNQPLFIKQGRQLNPTPAAEHLANRLQKHVEAIEGIWSSIQKSDSTSFPVHFATVSEFFSVVIAPELYKLNKHQIQLHHHFVHPNELKMLKTGQLDIAHLFAHSVEPGIEVVPFFKEAFYLVGNKYYIEQITNNPRKKLKTLWQMPWVTYDQSLLFIKDYCQQVFKAPFQGQIAHQLPDLWCILEAVKQGAGITVLPSYFCKQHLKQKTIYLLDKPKSPPEVEFFLAWREGAQHNTTLSKTIEFLLQAAAKHSI